MTTREPTKDIAQIIDIMITTKKKRDLVKVDLKSTPGMQIVMSDKYHIDKLTTQLQQARVLIASMYIQKDGWSDSVKAEVKKFML